MRVLNMLIKMMKKLFIVLFFIYFFIAIVCCNSNRETVTEKVYQDDKLRYIEIKIIDGNTIIHTIKRYDENEELIYSDSTYREIIEIIK